ncbi:MAG TPA: hypothetical protein VIV60_30500 [Polyangiaceae bacterium]
MPSRRLDEATEDKVREEIRRLFALSPRSTKKEIVEKAYAEMTGEACDLSSAYISNLFSRSVAQGFTAVETRSMSPLDRIHLHERGLIEAVRDLDDERNKLQDRIKEIDNLITKYRKL